MKIHSEYVVFDNTIFFVKCLISYIKITKSAIFNCNIERLFTNHNRREICIMLLLILISLCLGNYEYRYYNYRYFKITYDNV